MFLHSGASLHGHEYHTPQSQPRKKPFLRPGFPAPILRSTSSATVPDRYIPSSAPRRPRRARRPVSEADIQSIPALSKDSAPSPSLTYSPTVVRFKDVQVVASPTKPSMSVNEDPSVYDSDASQASSRRRKRRSTVPRKSANYLVAVPPRLSGSKKALFKTIRPRLVLQLQELNANQRARPTIDVFPSSLIAGPLATALYIHRFPRMFGAKRELGPRDLILVKSEDYTADTEEGDEAANSRRQPVAVLSPGRGQADLGEILLDDGSVWLCSNSKAHYNFVRTDEHGSSQTVRWVKRNASRRSSTGPGSPRVHSPLGTRNTTEATSEPDYRYTFSVINPMTRRHPVLATLTPQSLNIYDEYTTPSSSSNRFPPSRPASGAFDAQYSQPYSPAASEFSMQRETWVVDETVKKLIMITGLWLSLLLGPSLDSTDAVGDAGSGWQDTPRVVASSTSQSTCHSLPRRKTTSCGRTSPPFPTQATRIMRAMSTGAAFMQRRRRTDSSQAASSTTTIPDLRKIPDVEAGSDQVLNIPTVVDHVPKPTRRTSWFRKLMH